jgi:hypothetical protein
MGGDGSARRRFSSGVELAAMLVPLEDDDSFSVDRQNPPAGSGLSTR